MIVLIPYKIKIYLSFNLLINKFMGVENGILSTVMQYCYVIFSDISFKTN